MKSISFFIILIIFVAGAILYFRPDQNKVAGTATNSTQTTPEPRTEQYFNETASVMYFWSEECGYCQKQKIVLQELYNETELQVKSMDVGENPDYWQEYSISGTPTFISKTGEKLVGYQEKENLKNFLEKNK